MATTNVILKEKVDGLGAEADVVSVRRGYARNFLVPQGKAYEATTANLRHVEALTRSRALREADELQTAEKQATKLRKARITLELEIGEHGKAFGSITTSDIAAIILTKTKIDLDRHAIKLDKPIKATGSYEIPVKIHTDIDLSISVKVVTPAPKVASTEDNREKRS
ncbi:MAG: 50S ribosomal protein L9 [Verrucomicrobia bacterium]|nr:50S ribosomal protein L9 [Verrucomicrobiota bacterium]